MGASKKVSGTELAAHNSPESAWLAINGAVYDFTEFAPSHPGGSEIIYQFAGRDASEEYNQVHAPSLVQKNIPNQHIGALDAATLKEGNAGTTPISRPSVAKKPTLDEIINLDDFELAARQNFSAKSWAYVNGASNDNFTRDKNRAMLDRILLRPAIFRKVREINTRTNLFGCDLDFPVFISPMGTTLAAGPEGEPAQTKAADAAGVLQCISTAASYPLDEILEATPKHAWFQLYISKDRAKSEALVRRVSNSGKVKALFVTVDIPVISKREADERIKLENQTFTNPDLPVDRKSAGLARQVASSFDPDLSWDDIKWLRGMTSLPIIVKGIQRFEDAELAMVHGCDGIVVSNHGGRAADGAPASILSLLEIRKRKPEVFQKMKVLVDGGFRRGSDVLKALCLGASAVGLGRPFMYAVNFGEAGVQHALNIIKDEIETAMRLCGITDLRNGPNLNYVNTRDVDHFVQNYSGEDGSIKARL